MARASASFNSQVLSASSSQRILARCSSMASRLLRDSTISMMPQSRQNSPPMPIANSDGS